jgi:hypothetical protein
MAVADEIAVRITGYHIAEHTREAALPLNAL